MLSRLVNRRTLFVLMMASAVGVPYAAMNESWPEKWEQVKQDYFSKKPKTSLAVPTTYDAQLERPGAVGAAARSRRTATLVGPEIHKLEDVLRFDITPDWVTMNWTRVSPIQTDDFSGMRVPLVTGSNEDDLAGSLTYYFDDRLQVQRITFRGVTGNEGKLVALTTQQYKLKREPSRHAGLYVARWNRRAVSVVRVEHAAVVRGDARHSQKQIRMEINRPRLPEDEPRNGVLDGGAREAQEQYLALVIG